MAARTPYRATRAESSTSNCCDSPNSGSSMASRRPCSVQHRPRCIRRFRLGRPDQTLREGRVTCSGSIRRHHLPNIHDGLIATVHAPNRVAPGKEMASVVTALRSWPPGTPTRCSTRRTSPPSTRCCVHMINTPLHRRESNVPVTAAARCRGLGRGCEEDEAPRGHTKLGDSARYFQRHLLMRGLQEGVRRPAGDGQRSHGSGGITKDQVSCGIAISPIPLHPLMASSSRSRRDRREVLSPGTDVVRRRHSVVHHRRCSGRGHTGSGVSAAHYVRRPSAHGQGRRTPVQDCTYVTRTRWRCGFNNIARFGQGEEDLRWIWM